MNRKSGIAALGAVLMLMGCGPDLTGNYSGAHRKTSPYYQEYSTQLTLTQDGEKVSGQIFSQPSATASTGGTGTGGTGSYPYNGGYGGYGSMGIVNGTIQGTIDGDTLKDVRLTVNEDGCSKIYTGMFTISDGSRLQGSLIQHVTAPSTTDQQAPTYSQCSSSAYPSSVGSASFDVKK